MDDISVKDLLKQKALCDVINARCIEASPDITVEEALSIMREHKSGYVLLVEEDRKLAGIFTETDMVKKVLGLDFDRNTLVKDVMSTEPTVISQESSVADAINKMGEGRFYHLPLVDKEGYVTGMLSVRTLIRFLAAFYPTEVYNLPPDSDQVMHTPEGG